MSKVLPQTTSYNLTNLLNLGVSWPHRKDQEGWLVLA